MVSCVLWPWAGGAEEGGFGVGSPNRPYYDASSGKYWGNSTGSGGSSSMPGGGGGGGGTTANQGAFVRPSILRTKLNKRQHDDAFGAGGGEEEEGGGEEGGFGVGIGGSIGVSSGGGGGARFVMIAPRDDQGDKGVAEERGPSTQIKA